MVTDDPTKLAVRSSWSLHIVVESINDQASLKMVLPTLLLYRALEVVINHLFGLEVVSPHFRLP